MSETKTGKITKKNISFSLNKFMKEICPCVNITCLKIFLISCIFLIADTYTNYVEIKRMNIREVTCIQFYSKKLITAHKSYEN